MNNRAVTLTFLAVAVMSVAVVTTATEMSASDTNDTYLSTHQWNLVQWNDENLVEWYSHGLFINATTNSAVTFNLTEYQPSNLTFPSEGLLSIGNTTVTSDNEDIASSLTLSVWPWHPGLVTHINWTHHTLQATAAAESVYLQGTLTVEENLSYEFGSFNRKAVKFVYNQNSSLGNQNTSLVYDMATGVLLQSLSEIQFDEYYVIGLELSTSSLISSSNVSSDGTGSSSSTINDSSNSASEATTPVGLLGPALAFLTGLVVQRRKES